MNNSPEVNNVLRRLQEEETQQAQIVQQQQNAQARMAQLNNEARSCFDEIVKQLQHWSTELNASRADVNAKVEVHEPARATFHFRNSTSTLQLMPAPSANGVTPMLHLSFGGSASIEYPFYKNGGKSGWCKAKSRPAQQSLPIDARQMAEYVLKAASDTKMFMLETLGRNAY